MRGIVLVLLSAAIMVGCATVVPPPAAGDSSIIVGQLKVNISGAGMDPDGAQGFVSSDQPAAAALLVRNEASGKDYEIRTATPDGLFVLANAEPGHYRLLRLWAQVPTNNSTVTITSNFYMGVAFDIAPSRVENLGVNNWRFSYDLSHRQSANSFVLNSDYPAVEKAVGGIEARSHWQGYQADHVAFSGEPSARASAEALPPRDSNTNQIWVP